MGDILHDVAARLATALDGKVDVETLDEILAGVRRDWGGDRVYIANVGKLERDKMLLQDLGEHKSVAACARKYGISHRRIRQIKLKHSK